MSQELTQPKQGRRAMLVVLAVAAGACGSSPPPPAVAKPVRILDDGALLVGNGTSACTHQPTPSGDGHRWCGFVRGAGSGPTGELWVIDVTAAAGGQPPPCDGTSKGCLRLSTTLALRSATFFDGDTLIYHADPVPDSGTDFLGKIYAWRPGWTRGRQISSDRGFTCIGQRASTAAACFDDPLGDPDHRDSAEVRVGTLAGPDGDPLPAVGRWPLRNGNDAAWQAAFSPDGSSFVLSSAPTTDQPQVLSILPTSDAGLAQPTAVLDDVSHWNVSNDGQAIYFVRGLPTQADLYVADFPSGQGARLVEPAIASFIMIGNRPIDHAVGLVKNFGGATGEFKLLRTQSETAATSIFMYSNDLDALRVSPDLRYTVWMDDAHHAAVVRNDDFGSCPLDLDQEPPVFDPVFLDGASLIFWKQLRPSETSRHDAFYAPPDQCQPRTPFATDVDFFTPVGNRGLVFADGLDPMTSKATLKYIGVAGGNQLDPNGATVVQDGVASGSVIFVGASPLLLLVYSAAGDSADTTGVFVFGPVPISAP